MRLDDGLSAYKTISGSDWDFTLQVEAAADRSKELIHQFGENPSQAALEQVRNTLIDIEKWKAMCLRERMGNAERNSARSIWDSLRGAITARTDLEAIRWIMRLKGFGSSEDEETGLRRAKVASAVLRFLNPNEWGVVDWRTIVMMSALKRSGWNVDEAFSKVRLLDPPALRQLYDLVDEKAVCAENEVYRSKREPKSFPRAADVEMAIFGLSLLAWPMKNSATV